MEQTSTTHSRHSVLQTVGCHTKVNTGNFAEDVRPVLDELYEEGMLLITVDVDGDRWYHLTQEGKERLMTLNTEAITVTHASPNVAV